MAKEQQETKMLDPIAYRSDYDKNAILEEYMSDPNIPTVWPQNANLNYQKYWDDSNPEWQSQRWGLNPKYEWEWVMNTEIEYNPNLRTSDLDPNYLYWEDAKKQNSQEAGYIARRNDNIASALYNEWKITKADVANYLMQQNWWKNSTDADKLNTIDAVWKRLGSINQNNEEVDYSRLENIRSEDTSWTLYWKDTPYEWNPEWGIPALQDANSIFASMQESRIAKVKELLSMSTDAIAAAIYGWELSEWTQQMRDYQENYPQLYAEVQTKLKQYQWQWTIDAIANWWELPTNTNWTSWINNSIADFASENAGYSESMQDILKDVHQTISSSSSASAANDAMADMEEEMIALTKRLKNLNKEAQSVFKWDVPDYIVKAYINNRTQEIQDRLSILSDRYKYASNRYDKEVANAQWQKEYELKERQVKIQEESFALEDWKARNWVTTTNTNDKWTTNPWDKYQVTTMSDAEVASAVDDLITMFDNDQLWNAQCGVWIQRYYLPMLWISLNNISSFENKKALINEWEDYIPKKWDLIILSSKSSPENWHIWIVLWVYSDWTIEYMDWNGTLWADGKWTEKVAINWININNSKIQGFRNVNKWQWTSESSLYPWYEADETGYIEALWFNPLHAEIYEQINANKIDKSDMEWQAKRMWITEYELWRRADNYKLAKEKWLLKWLTNQIDNIDELTWIDYVWLTKEQLADIEKQIWYNPNSEWELKRIAEEGIPSTWPAMQNALKMTWAKDEDQLRKWVEHYRNKVNADAINAWEDILKLLAQLQNAYKAEWREREVKTKDWKTKTVFDTDVRQKRWWWRTWIKYEQLINQLLLDKVTEARKKWATFWQMTEYEWKILKDAASALKIKFWPWSTDESFSEAFFDLVDATWKLTNWTDKWPTKSEWDSYLKQIENESEWYMDWTGSVVNEEVDGSNLWWSQWTWTNTNNNEQTMNSLFGTGS